MALEESVTSLSSMTRHVVSFCIVFLRSRSLLNVQHPPAVELVELSRAETNGPLVLDMVYRHETFVCLFFARLKLRGRAASCGRCRNHRFYFSSACGADEKSIEDPSSFARHRDSCLRYVEAEKMQFWLERFRSDGAS